MAGADSVRVARNTGYLFLRMILVLVVGLYTSRVVLRALGFTDFGIYNVVGSVVVFFGFLRLALTNATYRYIVYALGEGDSDKLGKTYSMAINCHVVLAAALLIILEAIGIPVVRHGLNIPPERIQAAMWAYQFSILTFAFSILQTPFNSNVIAHEKMDFYALVSIVEVLLKLGLAFIVASTGFDRLIMYAMLLTVSAVVVFLFYVIYCKIKFRDCRFEFFWNGKLVKEFASYSGWSLLVNAADVSITQLISIFFNLFLGVIANAALGIANQVIGQLNSFMGTFTQAFDPQIIKSYASGRRDYFMSLIYSTSKITFLLMLFICLPLVANIDFVLRIWLGEYPPDAPVFIKAIIVYVLIDSFQSPLWQAVHATGRLKVHQILMFCVKILAIPAMYLALKLGADGATTLLIWASVNLLSAIVRTVYMKTLIGLDLMKYLKDVVFIIVLVAAVAVPAVLWLSNYMGSNLKSFLISSTAAVIVVGGLSYFVALNRKEREVLKSMPVVGRVLNALSR
ncbi:MAG: oligosaccharide flippase family protein [Bacteroidales bacterium]|nr:oligosaccharide flippase family protein [Bacteroidales bacterium]